MVCAGDGSRTYVRACLLRGRLRRRSLPPLIPRCSCWATMVWSSGEMIAVQSKISCRRWSIVCQFVRDRHLQRTTLPWWRLLMVQHGRCQKTMQCMLWARTRFHRRSFREVSSIRARRSCRTRTLPRCSGRLLGFNPTDQWESRFSTRQFLILEGCGLVVRRTMTLTERKMISGLAQVVQRIGSSAALRHLTEDEVANSSGIISSRYRELTNASDCNNAR